MVGKSDESHQDPSLDKASAGPGSLEEAIAERDRYLALAQRSQAELENYRKRVARDLEHERKFASQPLIADLISVIDHLELALETAKKAEATGIVEGLQMVQMEFLGVLEKHGVEKILPAAEPFDPNLHQAIMQQPTDEVPPRTVWQTVKSGYRLHDRVVRPAQVIVATELSESSS